MICLDPRVKSYLLLETDLLLFFYVNTITGVIIVVLLLLPFFLSGKTRSALRFAIIYMTLLTIGMMTDSVGTSTLLNLVVVAAAEIRMILPHLIAGAYTFSMTAPSELFCALRKCYIPEGIIIACAVVTRFFPIIMEDYRQIHDDTAMRSIYIGMFHPLQPLEYVIIPLLMNGSTVARDPPAAALTKGIGLSGRHTNMVQIKMQTHDWIYMIISAIPLIMSKGGFL